jgi:hypothetical protein
VITVSRPADKPNDNDDVLEGNRNRLSMQAKLNTENDIWFRRLFAEITRILG